MFSPEVCCPFSSAALAHTPRAADDEDGAGADGACSAPRGARRGARRDALSQANLSPAELANMQRMAMNLDPKLQEQQAVAMGMDPAARRAAERRAARLAHADPFPGGAPEHGADEGHVRRGAAAQRGGSEGDEPGGGAAPPAIAPPQRPRRPDARRPSQLERNMKQQAQQSAGQAQYLLKARALRPPPRASPHRRRVSSRRPRCSRARATSW